MVDEIRDGFYFLVLFLMIAASLFLCFPKLDKVSEMTHILLAVLIKIISILVAEFDLVKVVLNAFLTKLTI
jgi:hypothetical protein